MVEPQISFYPNHYLSKATPLTVEQTDSIDVSDQTMIRDDHQTAYNDSCSHPQTVSATVSANEQSVYPR